VARGGGVDSMLQFQFKRGDDEMKSCWKMKRRQRTRLGSMENKHDTAQLCGNVGRRRGGTGEGIGRRYMQVISSFVHPITLNTTVKQNFKWISYK
jgi:hypothetical protein